MAFYGRTGGPRRRKDEAVARMLQGAVQGFQAGREQKRERQAAAEETAYQRAEAARKADLEERRVKALEEGVAFKGEAKKGNETERIIKRTDDLTKRFLAKNKPLTPSEKLAREKFEYEKSQDAAKEYKTKSETTREEKAILDAIGNVFRDVEASFTAVPEDTREPIPLIGLRLGKAPVPGQARPITAADMPKILEMIRKRWGAKVGPEQESEMTRLIVENWDRLGGTGPPPSSASISPEADPDSFEKNYLEALGVGKTETQ